MHQRALVLALMATGAMFPAAGQAADDCSQMFVYSVNQFCRTLSNGFSQCQPVGMVGPAPNCAKPGVPPIMPVPLAPPVTQAFPQFNYMSPFPAPGVGMPSAAALPAASSVAPGASAPAVAAAPAPKAQAVPPAVATPAPAVAVSLPPAPAVVPVAASAVAQDAEPAKGNTEPAPVPAAPAVPVARIAAPTAVPTAAPAPSVARVDAVPPVSVAAAPGIAEPASPPVKPLSPAAPALSTPAPALVATPAPAEPEKPATRSPARSPTHFVLEDGLAHFDFDRAELSERARTELDAWLAQPLPKGATLRVTGHADRLGPAPYNLKLSGRRAETVKKYLIGKGVEKRDIKVIAKGEADPVKHCAGGASKATIACLAPNRRVEIDPE